LDNIGNTPLVRINKIVKDEGIKCELLAKCEYFNAGGSVKDRIGKRMIQDAEKSGRIKKGDTLIEPTSGNTGIGMALTAALMGYRMIITLPEKMSQEKVDVLKALGAEIIRTPTEAAFDSPDSHIGVAKRLNAEIKDSHILDQYANMSNPLAHYEGTADELIYQTDGKIDVVVVAAGTGGTITGLAKKLKEKIPGVQVVGVDPVGSILALPENLNGPVGSYKVEGIGYDFIPDVLERKYVDRWIKTEDKESFNMSRRLMKDEGLLVGGSAGSSMWAAVQVAKEMKEGQRVVVLLADSVRNYMSKFLNDQWMIDNGFMEDKTPASSEWWSELTISKLPLLAPKTVSSASTVSECVDIMNSQGFDQLPVVSAENEIVGTCTLGNLTSKLTSGRCKPAEAISTALYPQFKQVSLDTTLGQLSKIFDRDHFAVVTKVDNGKSIVCGVVTRIDLVSYIVKNAPQN